MLFVPCTLARGKPSSIYLPLVLIITLHRRSLPFLPAKNSFNSVWVCEILYKAGQTQAENVSAIIKAVRAKASVKYGRARGMSGKGEGAKEYLGYLEM